jgi:hypothetical protein
MATPPSHSQKVLPADNLILDKIERSDHRFLLHAHVQQTVRCPGCGWISRYRHSEYQRRLQDLPWQGCPVELRLKVRRFRCRNPDCARKVFAEPIPEVAHCRAPRTTRVSEIMRLIGYTAGGLPGIRILQRLALPASDDTVLRAVKQSVNAPADSPIRSLGVDDWAWRKGQSYGTIFVDLDQHRVVDLLPDRSTEAVRAWLERHPAIEIISRDRCGIYAEAAQQCAADALQVADRFHLLMNLSSAIEHALEERSSELCLASDVQPLAAVEIQPDPQKKTTLVEQRKQQRRTRRQERYDRVIELYHWAAPSEPSAKKLESDPKLFAAGSALASFQNENRPVVERVMFATSMSICSNVGTKDATKRLACLRRSEYVDTGAAVRWSGHVSSWRTKTAADIVAYQKEKTRSRSTQACCHPGLQASRAPFRTAENLIRAGSGELPYDSRDAQFSHGLS